MQERQLIDAIRALNPSAQVEFLAQFSRSDLADYLRRLQDVQERRLQIHSNHRLGKLRLAS